MRSTGCGDFQEYCDLVSSLDAPERDEFITAITTNVTSFFREPHHFDCLASEIAPKLLEKAKSGRRVRIWSAGCSSGQEPFTIAASLMNAAPQLKSHDFKILATDVNPQVLQEAREASYIMREDISISYEHGKMLFESWNGAKAGQFTIRQDLRDLVSFRRLNLMDRWPMSGPFDIIFCRNVAIYFDKDTQATLRRRFSEILAPGGYFFIGHSERVPDTTSLGLRPYGITGYVKS